MLRVVGVLPLLARAPLQDHEPARTIASMASAICAAPGRSDRVTHVE